MKKILNIISFFLIFYLSFSFQQSLGKETEWSNGIESQVRLISPLTHNNGQKEIFFGLQYTIYSGDADASAIVTVELGLVPLVHL